jgi:hypothetical protein
MHRIACTTMLLGAAAATGGCHPKRSAPPSQRGADTQPTATAAPVATPATSEFSPAGLGIHLTYPGEWRPVEQREYALAIAPAAVVQAGPHPTSPVVSLEIPKLPAHVPGLIPLGMVVNGYVDDMKKQYPGVKVDPPANTKVAGANARRVRSTWVAEGKTRSEEAVLTVHGDRVYILRADATAEDAARSREVLDAVLASVRWE